MGADNVRADFESVGEKAGLTGKRLVLYVLYMRERWGYKEEEVCLSYYGTEWAERFTAHSEWLQSDRKGQAILKRLTKEGYGDTIYPPIGE